RHAVERGTQIIDAQTSIRDVVAEWKKKLGADYEVVSVDLIPDKRDDGGLGISLEGTVDVLDDMGEKSRKWKVRRRKEQAQGDNIVVEMKQLDMIPTVLSKEGISDVVAHTNRLVNEVVLYGESHVTVRQALSRAASCSQRVRLTVSRKAQTVNVFVPRPEQSLPIAYPLLAAGDDLEKEALCSELRIANAKSETCIPTSLDRTAAILQQVSQRLRSRSLQPLTGLAIWKCVPMIVCLEKDSRGLGFSVVDYQVCTIGCVK
uniref:Uncharacterized protein n=1 Tax=Parascaris equorum TaxID=6256 RepID=A0A914RVU6_PAREQ